MKRAPGTEPAQRGVAEGKAASAAGAGEARGAPASERYRDLALIGEGGMGQVYRAFDTRLERPVALKLLRQDDPEQIDRLLREARLQARITHPNVCEVFEVGELEGRPYIAMQLVEGRSLAEAARELSIDQRVRLLAEVADAVHAAHRIGLIHRDLKPENILLERGEDGQPVPFVVDFGLAREEAVAGLTATGQLIGTPGFMPPEQARGETRTLDRRSDVWSLGAMLYSVLSGHRPFSGESTVQVLVQVLREDPPPLRSRAPHLPARLEAITHRCLQKDRDERYPSAKALAEDLYRYLDGHPAGGSGITGPSRRRRKAVRHPMAAGLLAAALLALVVIVTVAALERRRSSHLASLAQLFAQEADSIEARLRRAYFLPLHDTGPDRTRAREELRELGRRMEALGEAALGPGSHALGRGYLALGEREAARRELERAWRSGYRTPEVAEDLGLALGELYRRGLDELEAVGSEGERERRRDELSAELRDPMLRYLDEARVTEGPRADYLRGRIAFYDGRWQEAAQRAVRAFAARPWLYEAKRLEGEAWSRQGLEHQLRGDAEPARRSYETGRRALAEALTIARSDPTLYEAECRRRRRALAIELTSGAAPGSLFEEALELCRRGLEADARSSALWSEVATILTRWAEHRAEQGGEAHGLAEEARRAALRARALAGARNAAAETFLGEEAADPDT